jgi:exodeoxyribonuclease V alpha subunit
VGTLVAAASPPPDAAVADGIVVLDRVHRYGGAIARVAEAIRGGDADAVLAALEGGGPAVRWIDADGGEPDAAEAVRIVREEIVGAAGQVIAAAREGDAARALAALGAVRLLCAHRRGPHGVAWWTERIEGWLTEDVERFAADAGWYPGRPLLVTENDLSLRLFNGDTGVVVAGEEGKIVAAFDRGGEVVTLRPGRLEAVETVYAMTVHKSQGSQFDTAAVLLPPPTSPLLTRELLYTAVTRARERLVVVGPEASLRTAVDRPIARASGLRRRLWGDPFTAGAGTGSPA